MLEDKQNTIIEDRLERFFKILKNQILTPKEMESLLVFILRFIKEAKNTFDEKAKENLTIVNEAIPNIEQTYRETIENLKNEEQKLILSSKEISEEIINTAKDFIQTNDILIKLNNIEEEVSQIIKKHNTEFKKNLKDINRIINEVKDNIPLDGYTPVKGEDYFTDSEIKDIKDEVKKDILEQIPEQQNIEEIVKGINDLPTDNSELKIDAKHIKNLPEQVVYRGGSSGIKEVVAGSGISVDNSNLGYPVISVSGGSGANTALSNLSSVAINTSLISDTDNTDDLGSSSINWRTGYFGTSLISPLLKAKTTSGLLIEASDGEDVGLLGLANGLGVRKNVTWYGIHKFGVTTGNTVAFFNSDKELVSSGISSDQMNNLAGTTSPIQPQLYLRRQLAGSYSSTKSIGFKTAGTDLSDITADYENNSLITVDSGNNFIIQTTGNFIFRLDFTIEYDADISNPDSYTIELRQNGSVVAPNKIMGMRRSDDEIFNVSFESTPLSCSVNDVITITLFTSGVDDSFSLYESGSENYCSRIAVDYLVLT